MRLRAILALCSTTCEGMGESTHRRSSVVGGISSLPVCRKSRGKLRGTTPLMNGTGIKCIRATQEGLLASFTELLSFVGTQLVWEWGLAGIGASLWVFGLTVVMSVGLNLSRDYNCDSTTIRLRSDYTTYRARLLPFDAIRREQKTNMSFFRRSRVVVVS